MTEGLTDQELALHQAAIRLINATDGAASLRDVGRIRGTDWVVLLAEEAAIPLDVTRANRRS